MPHQTLPSTPDLIPIPENEASQIQELQRLVQQGKATLTSPDGLHQLELPDPLYRLLLRIIDDISQGKPIAYVHPTQDLTTQQAADFLGMSRQFLVDLLEKGDIPYHRVGTHRRLMLKDVLAYRKQRDEQRHQVLNQLAKEAADSGHYDDF